MVYPLKEYDTEKLWCKDMFYHGNNYRYWLETDLMYTAYHIYKIYVYKYFPMKTQTESKFDVFS